MFIKNPGQREITTATVRDSKATFRIEKRVRMFKEDKNNIREAMVNIGLGWVPETIEQWQQLGWELPEEFEERKKIENEEKAKAKAIQDAIDAKLKAQKEAKERAEFEEKSRIEAEAKARAEAKIKAESEAIRIAAEAKVEAESKKKVK